MNRNTYRCLLVLSGLFLSYGFVLQESVADDGTPLQTMTDTQSFPKSYGLLANEHLMYPVDMSDWPVKIDRSRQLFVDDYLIASTVGLKRTIHQALKNPSDPVVIGDRPWEGGGPIFQIVRRDKTSGRFRMWYAGLKRFDLPSAVSVRYPALYAESDDGIHWEKPALGLHEFEGTTANNIIIPAGSIFGLRDDPDEPNPERRYKAVVWHEPEYVPREGYYLYVSPDGIRWTRDREPPIAISLNTYTMPQSGIGDTSMFRWDRHLKKYIGDVKFVMPGKMRCRGLMESDDLIHWTRPRMTLYPDGLDDDDSQIYAQISFCYESMWLGFLRVMHTQRTKSAKQTTVELTASRDGRHFTRVGNREEVLPLGGENEWDGDYPDPAWDPIVVDDELWIYYRNRYAKQSQPAGYALGLARIRRDGFVSLDAGNEPGHVITRPMTFEGNRLFINAKTEVGGSIQVAVLASDGKPLPGFELENSTQFTGDSTHAPIVWTGNSKPSCPKGEHVRLQIRLKKAELYSFTVQ